MKIGRILLSRYYGPRSRCSLSRIKGTGLCRAILIDQAWLVKDSFIQQRDVASIRIKNDLIIFPLF